MSGSAITPARLAEIRARAAAATPGLWGGTSGYTGDPAQPEYSYIFADVVPKAGDLEGAMWTSMPGGFARYSDAAFCAHARQDIPDLLAALEAERSARAEAENEQRRIWVATEAQIQRELWEAATGEKDTGGGCQTAYVNGLSRHRGRVEADRNGYHARLISLSKMLARISTRIGADGLPPERLEDLVGALMDVVRDQNCECTKWPGLLADYCGGVCFAARWRAAVKSELERQSEMGGNP